MLCFSHEAAATRHTCNKLQEIQHCFENDDEDLDTEPDRADSARITKVKNSLDQNRMKY